MINNYLYSLSAKFPEVKFLKSIADTCIANYPDKNLPTLFIYKEGQLKEKFIGPDAFGNLNFKADGKYSLDYFVEIIVLYLEKDSVYYSKQLFLRIFHLIL